MANSEARFIVNHLTVSFTSRKKSSALFSENPQANPLGLILPSTWGALVQGYSLYLSEVNGSISNKEFYSVK